jgi:hypothetical protein
MKAQRNSVNEANNDSTPKHQTVSTFTKVDKEKRKQTKLDNRNVET